MVSVTTRKNGQVYKTYTGSGSQTLSWDGLLNGAAVPEGKYNIVLKNAKQPGKGRERDVAQVGVDMSPPEISYEIVRTASGRNTGQLKIVVTDKQSGVDAAATDAKSLANAEPGVPIIQQALTDKEKVEPKRQVRFYQLLFPDFVPTETQANSGGDFAIASESVAQTFSGANLFADINASNFIGLPFQIAANYAKTEMDIQGTCTSTNGKFSVHRVFNFDKGPNKPDIYFMILEKGVVPAIDIRYAKKCLICNSSITASPPFINTTPNAPYSFYDKETKRSYSTDNRQNTYNLMLAESCRGNECSKAIGKDQMSFYSEPDVWGKHQFLQSTDKGRIILQSLPNNYKGSIFMMAADLDRFPQNLDSVSMEVDINTLARTDNGIHLQLVKDKNNFWKVSCE